MKPVLQDKKDICRVSSPSAQLHPFASDRKSAFSETQMDGADNKLLTYRQQPSDGIFMHSKNTSNRMKEPCNAKIFNDRYAENIITTRKGNPRTNSILAVENEDQKNRLKARDASSDLMSMRQSSMHDIRTVHPTMPRRQRSESRLVSRSASMKKLPSDRKLVSRSSSTQRIEKGSASKRKMPKQRSEATLSSHHLSDDNDLQKAISMQIYRASSQTAITKEQCDASSCLNWKHSGEAKQPSRPNFRKQLSDVFYKSSDGLKDSLHKRIPIQQVFRSTKDRATLGRSKLAFSKQACESSLDANSQQSNDKQKHDPQDELIQPQMQTIPKSMLEQKLALAWRKQSIPQRDDESAVTEYMRIIDEKYGVKTGGSHLFEETHVAKDHDDDDNDDTSAAADYFNMNKATCGSRDDNSPTLRGPLGVLEERTDHDESEATLYESAVVSSKESAAQVARHRRASLSDYLGSSFEASAHTDGNELVTMERKKSRRASLSDFITHNHKSTVSVQLSVMTVISTETG